MKKTTITKTKKKSIPSLQGMSSSRIAAKKTFATNQMIRQLNELFIVLEDLHKISRIEVFERLDRLFNSTMKVKNEQFVDVSYHEMPQYGKASDRDGGEPY